MRSIHRMRSIHTLPISTPVCDPATAHENFSSNQKRVQNPDCGICDPTDFRNCDRTDCRICDQNDFESWHGVSLILPPGSPGRPVHLRGQRRWVGRFFPTHFVEIAVFCSIRGLISVFWAIFLVRSEIFINRSPSRKKTNRAVRSRAWSFSGRPATDRFSDWFLSRSTQKMTF